MPLYTVHGSFRQCILALYGGRQLCQFNVLYILSVLRYYVYDCAKFTRICSPMLQSTCYLHWWCFSSINWHNYYACTDGGRHLQLALVVFFICQLTHLHTLRKQLWAHITTCTSVVVVVAVMVVQVHMHVCVCACLCVCMCV